MISEPLELLRMNAVQQKTSLSRPHIYLLMRRGLFPKSVKLGRATAWVRSEVEGWVKERMAERDARHDN